MDDEIFKEIEKYACLPRQHASYYNYHDKEVKESGIVADFLEEKNHQGAHQFVSFTVPKQDPPDAYLYDNQKIKTALEITELVNANAIGAQIHKKQGYSSECERWADLNYFEDQINKLILKKQGKCEKLFELEAPVHLLLHTDEEWIELFYKKHLSNGATIHPNSFSCIWLLLSHSPHTRSNSVIKLWENV